MYAVPNSCVEDFSQVLEHIQKTIDTVEAAMGTKCHMLQTDCPVTKTVYDSLMDLKAKITYIATRSGLI